MCLQTVGLQDRLNSLCLRIVNHRCKSLQRGWKMLQDQCDYSCLYRHSQYKLRRVRTVSFCLVGTGYFGHCSQSGSERAALFLLWRDNSSLGSRRMRDLIIYSPSSSITVTSILGPLPHPQFPLAYCGAQRLLFWPRSPQGLGEAQQRQ